MPCRCNTLSLFIRSIAQVDLPTSPAFRATSQSSVRNFRPAKSAEKRFLPRRTYSTAPSPNSESLDGLRNAESISDSHRWVERRQESQTSTYDANDAFVEFSPEAVEAIAVQLAPQQPSQRHESPSMEYETPLKSLLKDLPVEKPSPTAAPVSRTTFRRTKVENESFTLHYSSPRSTDSSVKLASRSVPKPAGRDDWKPPARERWQIDKEALSKKFPGGWNPPKRLSPDAVAGIRALHAQMPERYTTEALSQEFGVTAEAIRRILKSKWSPSPEEETDRQRRWLKRGQQVWSRYAELGLKPPRAWREMGIGQGKPEWMTRKQEWTKRQQEPRILPALITTTRRREADSNQAVGEAVERSSLADRIL
jgi:hypothetical protein